MTNHTTPELDLDQLERENRVARAVHDHWEPRGGSEINNWTTFEETIDRVDTLIAALRDARAQVADLVEDMDALPYPHENRILVSIDPDVYERFKQQVYPDYQVALAIKEATDHDG